MGWERREWVAARDATAYDGLWDGPSSADLRRDEQEMAAARESRFREAWRRELLVAREKALQRDGSARGL